MKRLLLLCLLFSTPSFGVITVFGDSIFGYKTLLTNLDKYGVRTEDFSVNGAKIKDIFFQYYRVRAYRTVDTILMDAGGNDVLKNNDCYQFNEECIRVIYEVKEILDYLLTLMEIDGVDRVIFLGYYHMNKWPTKQLNPAIDLGSQLIKEVCENSRICEYIETRPAMAKYDGNPISWDRVHPNEAGYAILTDLVLDIL